MNPEYSVKSLWCGYDGFPVPSLLPDGARTPEQVAEAVKYSNLCENEKEYATVLANAPAHRFTDKCVCCGH